MKLIMVDGGTLAHAPGSPISGGTFTITSTPSTSVLVGDQGVFRGALQYTFSGGSASGFVPGSIATVVAQSINPTAKKVHVDGSAVVLEGDSGTMAAQGTTTAVPPATAPVSGDVQVDNAGQTKGFGE